MNYKEIEETIYSIRNEYFCKGDIIFKAAIFLIMNEGIEKLNDENFVSEQLEEIDKKHEEAEKQGKVLFMAKDFEKSIVECAVELTKIEAGGLIEYIQHNWLYYNMNEIDYQRAIEILEQVIDYEGVGRSISELTSILKNIGFRDEELEQFNFSEEDIYGEEQEKKKNGIKGKTK